MMERYRRASRQHLQEPEKVSFKIKIIRQSIICVVIFAIVFVVGLLKTETADNISKHIHSSLSYTVDYESAVKDILTAINNYTRGIKNDVKETDKIN